MAKSKGRKYKSLEAKAKRIERIQQRLAGGKTPYQHAKLKKEMQKLKHSMKVQQTHQAQWAPYNKAKASYTEALKLYQEASAKWGRQGSKFSDAYDIAPGILDLKSGKKIMEAITGLESIKRGPSGLMGFLELGDTTAINREYTEKFLDALEGRLKMAESQLDPAAYRDAMRRGDQRARERLFENINEIRQTGQEIEGVLRPAQQQPPSEPPKSKTEQRGEKLTTQEGKKSKKSKHKQKKAEKPKKAKGPDKARKADKAKKPERAKRPKKREKRRDSIFDLKNERERIKKIKDPEERARRLEELMDRYEHAYEKEASARDYYEKKSEGLPAGESVARDVGKGGTGNYDSGAGLDSLIDDIKEDPSRMLMMSDKTKAALFKGEFLNKLYDREGAKGLTWIKNDRVLTGMYVSGQLERGGTSKEVIDVLDKMYQEQPYKVGGKTKKGRK